MPTRCCYWLVGAAVNFKTMKTVSGYETNGTYLKFKSGFTTNWKVEVKEKIHLFETEEEADEFIFNMKLDRQNEILKIISDTYKLINFTDQVEEPYRENVRQARKKLNTLASMLRAVAPTCQ